MTETVLQSLPFNELLTLMVTTIDELLAMQIDGENLIEIQEKRKEIELIHKVMVAKREQTQPG